jgi:RHS repeat-associated protein/CSLREA domain-containing protein
MLERLEDRMMLAANITVNTTADGNIRDDVLTLREAILVNNLTLPITDLTAEEQAQVSGAPSAADRDTITFDIPAGDPGHIYYQDDGQAGLVSQALIATTAEVNDGNISDIDPDWPHSWWSLRPTSALPSLSSVLTIDGYTQPGASANTNTTDQGGSNAVLVIEINGSAVHAAGLEITAGDSTLHGLVINRFEGPGVILRSGGNLVAGNFIGTNAAGAAGLANGGGVRVDGASDNTVGGDTPEARNLISGNNSDGVLIISFGSTANGNRVLGNLIGTNAAGTAALGNAAQGVHLESVFGAVVSNNVIGGSTAAARNVIAGNSNGVSILQSGVTGNQVQGNFIGTDVTGNAGLANQGSGVILGNSTNSTISGNVISGNRESGVIFFGSSGNHVLGNRIGTNAAGTTALGNREGVTIFASGNVIGSPGTGNVISGNSAHGVRLSGNSTTDNVIQSNRIGTDAAGTGRLGNGFDGVLFEDILTSNNLVGGTDADDGTADGVVAAGNLIAFNGLSGVHSSGGTGNRFLGNSIFANAHLGIDLGGFNPSGDGVTLNDAGDADTGPNNRQNFPVLTAADRTPTTTTIHATLASTPDRDFRVEFFASTLAAGSHAGQTFIGALTVHTGVDGNTPPLSFTASGDFRDRFFTATATDLTTNDTSEFSKALPCPALIVTTTADVVDPNDGVTSLREAVSSANDTFFFPGPDAITFNIPAGDPGHVYYRDDGQAGRVSQARIATTAEVNDGNITDIDPDWQHSWWSLRRTSALPFLNSDLTIDGYSQPGASANTLTRGTDAVLRIELDGSGVTGSDGFTVLFATATIQGIVINRFTGSGISLLVTSNDVVTGNFIGTDVSGSLALGNLATGVNISGAVGITVGGTTPAARNLISGNRQDGVTLTGDTSSFLPLTNSQQIVGNLIGTDRTGTGPLGNAVAGVRLATGFRPVNDNAIEGNTIAFNGQDGVAMFGGGVGSSPTLVGNHVLSNSIFANGGLGINIGVHQNDPRDTDGGLNNGQNFPVLTEIVSTALESIVFGTLNSNPRTKFLLQFFASDQADPSGNGEGQTLLGETVVVTDSAGNVSFGAEVPVVIPESAQVSATATRLFDHDSDPATPEIPIDTSEFSHVISGRTSELQLGQTIERDLALGQELRFRLTVPPGTDARVKAQFLDPRLGELFINVGTVPDVNTFIGHAIGFVEPNPEFLLAGSSVPYFITVRGTSTAAVPTGHIVLSAEALGLEILEVGTNQGSNAGQVTTTIVGAGFTEATRFSLVAPDGSGRGAVSAVAQNDTTFFVTFDLVGLAPGLYDVRATDGSSSAVADDAFTVTTGSPGHFTARLVLPTAILRFREAPLVVEYTNDGGTDIPAPVVIIASREAKVTPQPPPPRIPLVVQGGGGGGGGGGSGAIIIVPPLPPPPPPIPPTPLAKFLAISKEGPAGVLPPGATGRFEFRFQDDGSLSPDFHPSLNFLLIVASKPEREFDLTSSKDELRPPDVDAEAWDIIFNNLVERLGGTVGSYTAALDDAATYLSKFGTYTGDIDRLLAPYIEQANGAFPGQSPAAAVDAIAPASGVPLVWGRTFAPTISRRFDLGILGRGWSHPWDFRLSRDDETSDVAIRTPGGTRRFTHQLNGTFLGESGDPGELTEQHGFFLLREPGGTVSRFDATTGRLLDLTDRNGNQVTLNYTGGRLTSLVHSDGDRFDLGYNSQGRLSRLTDQADRVTTYTYDASGEHLLRVTGPDGTIEYTYDTTDGSPQEHAPLSVARPDGSHVFYEYDAQGRLRRTSRDGGVEPVTLSYGNVGEVFVTDARNQTNSLFFDEVGQLLETRDPLGRSARFEYDLDHRIDRLTLPLDTISTFDFDSSGNPTHLVKADNSAISISYDPKFSVPLTVRDEQFRPLRYEYDVRGNPTDVIRIDGSSEQFEFDDEGNVTLSVNRRGDGIDYTYDARGLLLRKDHANGSFEAFTYDDRGNLRTATDARGTTTLEYDLADRLTKVTYPDGRFLRYSYDGGGRRTRLQDQDGFAVNYRYDSAGRLERLTNASDALIVAYNYDEVGRLAREDHSNGTSTEYTYDQASQLTSLVHRLPDGSVSSRFDYTYDALGRRTSMTTLEGVTTFGYDAIGQLTLVTLPGGRVIQYEYDPAGNRKAVIDDGVRTVYTPNDMNQYTQVGTRIPGYDRDGNLIADGAGAEYGYDDENRLLAFDDGTTSVRYEYDALGQRMASVENGVRTEYLVDPTGLSNVAAEYDATGNVVSHYVHGGFGLVSRFDANNVPAFYDYDAIGSTAAMTGPDGSVVNRYAYLPFGEPLSQTETIPNTFEYVGQLGVQRDRTGLDFMRERYYAAAEGRFIHEDPISVAGGLNLYRYVENQPTGHVDPAGLNPLPISVGLLDLVLETEIDASAVTVISNAASTLPTAPALPGLVPIGEGASAVTVSGATGTAVGSEVAVTGSGAIVGGGATSSLAAALATDVAAASAGALGAAVIVGFGLGFGLGTLIADFTPLGHVFGDAACDFFHCDDPDFHFFAPPGDPVDGGSTPQVRSRDPNDIIGPAGFGDQQFVPENTPFLYTIHFENLAAATAAAQTVTVTQQLDPELDFTTFELLNFGLGDRIVNIPSGRSAFVSRFDLNPDKNLFLDVTAEVNVETGVVTWSFTSLDPATLDLPDDPLGGFLPPNEAPPEGEGFVTYLVQPKTGLATGTRIDAQGTVIFDGSPLDTPAIFHTIDADPPISQVNALPTVTNNTSFIVSWSGSDDATGPTGSGITSFDIFVSDNGAAFVPFKLGTTDTSATFTGLVGHMYGFFSVATDNVGHRQAAPPTAQASTTLLATVINGPHVTDVRLPVSRKKVQGIVMTFDQQLNQLEATRLQNYDLRSPGKDKRFGTRDDKAILLRSAEYNPASNTVTLRSKKQLKVNQAFQITVRDTLTNVAGTRLDGDNDGTPGGDHIVRAGAWSSIEYLDGDGDKVHLWLTSHNHTLAIEELLDTNSAGWMEVLWGPNVNGRRVQLADTVPGETVLRGTVKRGVQGDGLTTLESVLGTDGVKNRLTDPPFQILDPAAVDLLLESANRHE